MYTERNPSAVAESTKDPVTTYATDVSVAEGCNGSTHTGSMALLATASIILESPQGSQLTVRELVDPASECSFVSEHIVQSLSLHKIKEATPICGVGDRVNVTSQHTTQLILRSTSNTDFCINFLAIVLRKLTSMLPKGEFAEATWEHLRSLQLADPNYRQPARIDCILGADVYPAIVLPGL